MLAASTKTISRQTAIKGRAGKTNKKGVRIHEEAKGPGERAGGVMVTSSHLSFLPIHQDAGGYWERWLGSLSNPVVTLVVSSDRP